MAVESLQSGRNYASVVQPQPQTQVERAAEKENDKDQDDAAKAAAASASTQPSVNTSGQTVGLVIHAIA